LVDVVRGEETAAPTAAELDDAPQRQIEKLKAGLDEMNRNSAGLAEQLKAGQELTRNRRGTIVTESQTGLL
jgi:hypothetical protein